MPHGFGRHFGRYGKRCFVAHGFLGDAGNSCGDPVSVKRISEAQEKQFTTLGENITALEVSGTFDDCRQRLVKQAFSGCRAEQARVFDVGQFDQYRATAAADVLPCGGVPAVASGFGAADRVGAERKFRQPYRGNFCEADWVAGGAVYRIDECERCRAGVLAVGRVSSAPGAANVLQRDGRRQPEQFSAAARSVPRTARVCAARNLQATARPTRRRLAAMKSLTRAFWVYRRSAHCGRRARMGSVQARACRAIPRARPRNRSCREICGSGSARDRYCSAVARSIGGLS